MNTEQTSIPLPAGVTSLRLAELPGDLQVTGSADLLAALAAVALGLGVPLAILIA